MPDGPDYEAIALRPDDDEPRLAFASAVEAEDPLRARLIRVQVRLANLAGRENHPEWLRLALEAQRLIQAVSGSRWMASYGQEGVLDLEFHRGFIERVTIRARLLLHRSRPAPLLEREPIQHLDVVDLEWPGELREIVSWLAESGRSSRIRSLRLDGQRLDDEAIDHLVTEAFAELCWLSLAYNDIREPGVRRLAAATYNGPLSKLAYVNLRGNPFDPIEEVDEDQGVVIATRIPRLDDPLPPVAWLQREVIGGRLIQPDRFARPLSVSSDRR
jgi:uncharacterized protein (TIGR02996 family)